MENHVGQRISYHSKLCTVRFVGKIQDRDGLWLGVEWDDETLGKHDGSLKGRRYFHCLNPSATAASFIRPSRKADPTQSLLQALQEKYAKPSYADQAIQISGKTVEEVGFEKIQLQIQDFQELRTVILDRRCISLDGPDYSLEHQVRKLEDIQLKVRELDLSYNLLETWSGVLTICAPLTLLRDLDVSGNRFSTGDDHVPAKEAHRITVMAKELPNLVHLNASRNSIAEVSSPLQGSIVTKIDLSYNRINSLEELAPLSELLQLSHLYLRGNPVAVLTSNSDISFKALTHLDLADTHLKDLQTLDNIPKIFPSLDWLLVKDTPLSRTPSAALLSIARLPNLRVLNHVVVSHEERQNAEIYYLGTIAKQLESTSDKDAEVKVLQNHQQWENLCRAHGTPEIKKPVADAINPDTLEARTTAFTFYIAQSAIKEAHRKFEVKTKARQLGLGLDEKPKTSPAKTPKDHEHLSITESSPKEVILSSTGTSKEQKPCSAEENKDISPVPAENNDIVEKIAFIPLTTSTYALQGVVGHLFALPPPFTSTLRLFLEINEWISSAHSSSSETRKLDRLGINHTTNADNGDDGNGDGESDSGWSLSQDDDEVYNDVKAWLRRRREREKEKGSWVIRKVELEGGTRGVGNFVSWKGLEIGKEARVRVEVV